MEWWRFDFAAVSGAFGGAVDLRFRPGGPAWYWAAVAGDRRRFVLVKDLDVPMPRRPDSMELRADGLWADANCETPFEHWSIGLEAFGLALDDPDDAFGSARGDRTALGLDLEWEAAGEIAGGERDYGQPSVVHGVILIGAETIAVDGRGWRGHGWIGG